MGKLRIISRSDERFRDRVEAGELLGRELSYLRGEKAVVLGIPRGGVVAACEVAEALDADLDIVLSRKLRTPGHPELALGSVAEDGKVFLNETVVWEVRADDAYIQQEKAIQLLEITRRKELIRRILPKVPLERRLVIIIDDGVATGATFQAALWAVRQERPRKLIAALPVGPEDTLRRLSADADEIICLRAPPFFAAVGQFYLLFEQVTDEYVLEILGQEQRRKGQELGEQPLKKA